MEIQSDRVYTHERLGDVLVVGINRVFTSFDSESMTGENPRMLVRYATEWDGYGPMISRISAEDLDEFVAAIEDVGEKLDFSSNSPQPTTSHP